MEATLFGLMALIFVLGMWWWLESGRRSSVDPVLLNGRRLTVQDYDDLGEIKMELSDGYLGDRHMRTRLLRALIANEGLIRVVRLAPDEAWRAALRQSSARAQKRTPR